MPYLCLGAAALVMLAVAWRRMPAVQCAWAFLLTGGAVTLGDLVVTGVFSMYVYRPGFLPGHPDNYFGVLIAECLFVPAYYTFLASLSSRYRYLIHALAVIPVILIEALFIHLGVYVHRTWTFWHSVIAFSTYGIAAAYAFDSFTEKGYTRVHRLLLVAATVYYAMNLYGLLPFGVLRLATMHLWLVRQREMDLVLSSLLLHAVPFTTIGIVGTWYKWTRSPIFLAAVCLGFALWLTFLRSWGIWAGRPPWNPWFAGGFVSLFLAGVAGVDSWFTSHTPRRIPAWEPPNVD